MKTGRSKKMIRKNDRNLLQWICENVVDFEDENDESGLTWNSTHEDALKFMGSIPPKEKAQKYGIYSCRMYFIEITEFDDIKEGLEKGFISRHMSLVIYRWNKSVGRKNWDMSDVDQVLHPEIGSIRSNNFIYNNIKHLLDMGVMECINPEVKTGKIFRLTEKGERILEST